MQTNENFMQTQVIDTIYCYFFSLTVLLFTSKHLNESGQAQFIKLLMWHSVVL